MPEPERTERGEGIWGWIKAHAAWLGGGFVAIVVLYFMVFGQKQQQGAPTSIGFPPQGGGPPSNLNPPTPPTPPPTAPPLPVITLPYSPDFNILTGITDGALRSLWEQAYNLELQINQATLNGQDPSAFASALKAVMDQIKNYKPPAQPGPPPDAKPPPASPPGGNPPPTGPPQFTAAILALFTSNYLNATKNFTDPSLAFNQWVFNLNVALPGATSVLNTSQLQYIFNAINQSVAFNPQSPFRNPAFALSYFNNALTNPGSIPAGSGGFYYYSGSRMYRWVNGVITDVTSQFSTPQNTYGSPTGSQPSMNMQPVR